MTSFVHVDYPRAHPGVTRIENAVANARQWRQGFDGTKGLAAMLLAAMVAALLVVADQLIDTWADGHLLAAWVVLWVIGFAATALLIGPTLRLARRLMGKLDSWSHGVAQRRADARLWAIAEKDPRVMADLQAAISRTQD